MDLPSKARGQLLTLVGLPAMFIVVGIVNKVRAGKFAPRRDELRQIKASQQRSRLEQLFIASLVIIAAPMTSGLLALSPGHYLKPTSPLVAAAIGIIGLICGLIFAVIYVVHVVRRTAQSQ